MGDISNIRVAEYSALREEIQRKVDTQFQVVSLTLLVAGTFLSLGLTGTVNHLVLLVYPIIATFLAAEWTHKSVSILLIARYIRDKYEQTEGGPEWETWVRDARKGKFPLTFVAAFGVFLGTQLLAVALAYPHLTYQPQELGLLAIDGICVLFTLVMIGIRR